jgi:peroxiredoxin
MNARVFALLWCLLASAVQAAGEYSNRRAPGFSLPNAAFVQHDLLDFRGKIVLIDFMKTDCPHCQTLTATLEKVKAKFGPKVQVISVVLPPDTPDTISAFVKKSRTTSLLLMDSGQMMMSYLKITPSNMRVQFPHLFIVDGNGWIRNDASWVPGQEGFFSEAALTAEINKALLPATGSTGRK